MKRALLSLRSWTVRQKIHFMRGYGYFGFVGMGYLVSAKLKEHLFEMGVDVSMLIVGPAALLIVWLLGYLEIRLGFFHDEVRYNAKNSPAHQHIRQRLEELSNEIKHQT